MKYLKLKGFPFPLFPSQELLSIFYLRFAGWVGVGQDQIGKVFKAEEKQTLGNHSSFSGTKWTFV